VRLTLSLCQKGVKLNINITGALRRPIALMLTLLPAAALVVSYGIVQWTSRMTAHAHITNPELALTIEGYATFFRDYAIPVLILSLGLAALNLWCAFSLENQ
jgi:hypothetical protein